MPRPERLAELAARISDGERIDWAGERARAIDEEERRLVDELASIHRVMSAIRGTAAAPTTAAPAGTLSGKRVGPYVVEERVGLGGMGEVYRARDERLGRFVAIKALAPALSTDEFARRRFLRETRLACRVTHPYVATVHDVLDEDGRVLLVMEWLSGDSLSSVLATGPVPATRAGIYAREIAEALQAVHRAGVVHRDLKPANVMLTPDGHIKVMDFGVALHVFEPDDAPRTPASAERLTRDGRGVGTISYMSPEQLRGGPIDARSDLFALGILLWELLTGAHPFARATAYETATAILNDPPGSGEDDNFSAAAGPLGPTVLRLLEKDAARRHPSATALIAELNDVVSVERPTPIPPSPSARRRIARLVGPVVLGLAVLAGAGWLLTRNEPAVVVPGDRPLIAVIPFEDRAPATAGSLRGELTASLLGAGLFESGQARPVDAERIASLDVASRPGAVERVFGATRASYVVTGELWDEGETVVGTLRVFRSGRGDPEAAYPIRAGSSSAFAAIAADRILGTVASGNGVAAAERGVGRGTTSDEAREAEFRARAALRVADFGAAIAALEAALRIDPSFVAARTVLAEALYRAGYVKRAREEADRASKDAQAHARRTPERVALEAEAVHAMVHEAAATELEARRSLSAGYPADPGLLIALGDSIDRAGKPDEALGVLSQVEAIDPGDVRAHLSSARIAANLKKFDVAEASLAKCDAIAAPDGAPETRARIAMQRGQIAMVQGRYKDAATAYRIAAMHFTSADARVPAARAERSALDAEVVMGGFAKTAGRYDAVLDVFRSAGAIQDVVRTLNASGGRYFLAGDTRNAEPILRSALAEGRALDNPMLVAYPKLNLAALLIHTGRSAEARGLADEALSAARENKRRDPELLALSLLAEAKMQQGLPAEAIADYREVAALSKAGGGTNERLGYALYNEADIEEYVGAVADGLVAADAAIAELKARKQSVELAYALAIRARLKSQAADWKGVDADLAEATRLADAAGEEMKDQRTRIALARAGTLLRRGDWKQALRAFDGVRDSASESKAVGIVVPALLGACRAALELQRHAEAERRCTDAERDARALPHEQAEARVLLAEVYLGLGRPSDAETVVRRAIDEATRMELAPCALHAFGVLAAVAPPADRPEAQRNGAAWLDRYRERLPESARARLRDRKDLAQTLERLEIAVP
jgi:serine/threonine protein kinase/tetratricopeptide (TPR) repeat protein